MGEGVSFFGGAMDVKAGSRGAPPTHDDEPKNKEGGPIDVVGDEEDVYAGHSMGVPASPSNAVDHPSEGSADVLTGPINYPSIDESEE